MSGLIIARRLQEEFGVEFLERPPTRAHRRSHGDLIDTFLVREWANDNGVRIFSTIVPWRWNGLRGMEIALQHEVPTRKLAKARLNLKHDGSFSPYGTGLFVSDADWGK